MNSPLGELILYRTDDGRTEVHLRAAEGTVWMTQGEMAALFDTTPQNIIQSDDGGEVDVSTTCKNYLQVRPRSIGLRPARTCSNIQHLVSAGRMESH